MRFLAIPAFLLLGACAHVDVGQVDYRVADDSMCKEFPCRVDLAHKYLATQAPFEKDDVYSIELEQAVIGKTLLEGVILGKEIGNRAEYAILANTFELDSEGKMRFIEVPEYDGAAAGGPKMKLIYYGDDIARNQPFNFSNIPFMPRAVYNGGTIGIQIVVKELDNESPAITSLLETLADYGKTIVPGPPQIASMLFDLGGSLLKGSKDDRLLDYRFELRNAAGVQADGSLRPTAAFAPGRYVIRRSDERATDMVWSGLTYDYDRGRLIQPNGEEFRKEFYLVLNITKYNGKPAAENYVFQDWTKEVRDSIQAASDPYAGPVAVVTEHMSAIIEGRRSTQLRSTAAEAWSKSDQQMRQLPKVTFKNLTDGSWQCPAVYDPLKLKRDMADQTIRDAVRLFVSEYRVALEPRKAKGAEGEGKVEFSPADRAALVSLVARSFMPWVGEIPNEFKTADEFEKVYITPGDNALADYAIATMVNRAPASNCTDPQAIRLAGG